jgi:dolichol-phosphate mannosyltransferase
VLSGDSAVVSRASGCGAEIPELSIVAPVFRCAPCLEPLTRRLKTALAPVVTSYELILVDDRSPDGAWEAIHRLAQSHPHVRAIRLSRNFGQHAAITAGLAEARGARVVVMDCDLQEPPEAIPILLAKACEGFDVVHTRRRMPRQSLVRRTLGRAYFRLRDALTQNTLGADHGTMSILSRRVVDAFLMLRDRDREYLAILAWLGFEQTTVEVDHSERHAGKSSYGLGSLTRLALDGIFFQTTVFLNWIVIAGFLVAGLGTALAIYYFIMYIMFAVPPGYTSLAVLVLLMSGAILVSVGVTGLYVGRTFEQAKGRPIYIVDERLESADKPLEVRMDNHQVVGR